MNKRFHSILFQINQRVLVKIQEHESVEEKPALSESASRLSKTNEGAAERNLLLKTIAEQNEHIDKLEEKIKECGLRIILKILNVKFRKKKFHEILAHFEIKFSNLNVFEFL